MTLALPYKLRALLGLAFRQQQGEAVIRGTFRRTHGYDLDEHDPHTFSEKLFARLLQVNVRGDATLTRLSDKLQVRSFVAQRAGERYLVPLLWSGRDPKRIPFDELPDRCMVKTNHGSGGNVLWERGGDQARVLERMRKSLRENFYWVSREYHYSAIPRRVLVEAFLDDDTEGGPLDYRFWCFHGTPELIQVDNHAHDINPFYDTQWNKLPLSYRKHFRSCDVPRPAQLDEMLQMAKALAQGFDFVRVDLYNIRGRVYFGELTFTPVAGKFRFSPPYWDEALGRKWAPFGAHAYQPR